MATTGSSLSVWELLDFLPIAVRLGCVAALAAVTAPFRSSNTPKTFKTHVVLSISRAAFSRLSLRQRQYLTGSTESHYLSWVKKTEFRSESLTLRDGTKVFLVGSLKADYVVLYLHGGGWSMPANTGHFEFAASMVKRAEEDGKSLCFAFVQYDLAPHGKYPSQISQCVEMLRYALQTLHKDPSNIILVGDSAGGTLVMSVISHILHPQPNIKPVILTAPLKAAAVFSPWVNLCMDGGSVLTNQMQDPVTVEVMKGWADNYLGAAPLDFYNQPRIAISEWWRGMPVEQLLITGAAREMLADDLVTFAETMKDIHKPTTVFFAPDDFHAQPVLGPEMGLGEGQQGPIIREWLLKQVE
ncbi:alpha/beta-hydrolase [Stipitochalara longipes BDJ]|nr:alpha/beta-hydrolase [Stipitochalara longipes BDJ]